MCIKQTPLKTIVLLFAFTVSISIFAQPALKVTDCDMHGWVKHKGAGATGTINLVNDPANPPLGKGSLRFQSADKKFVRVLNEQYIGTLLSSITELSFSTFIEQRGNTVDNSFVVLIVDVDNNGVFDYPIVFNSQYQTGAFLNGFPNQDPTVMNTWQTWNMLVGGWWRGLAADPDNGGRLFTIASLVQQYPNARIIAGGAAGSMRINGSSPVTIGTFIGYVDNFRIGINHNTTVYDFEGDRVLVCHNGETACIASSALNGHLNHGDLQGSCPLALSRAGIVNPISEFNHFNLSNYPNPSRGNTRITYSLPSDSKVLINVFDISARKISTLVNELKTTGTHHIDFNTKILTSGIYYYKIMAVSAKESFTKTNKLIIQ